LIGIKAGQDAVGRITSLQRASMTSGVRQTQSTLMIAMLEV